MEGRENGNYKNVDTYKFYIHYTCLFYGPMNIVL